MTKLTAAPVDCIVHARSAVAHLQQIYAGFTLLARSGTVRVHQVVARAPGSFALHSPLLRVEVGPKRIPIVYDVHDGPDVDAEAMARCALYFKRSLLPAAAGTHAKLRPLGLNCDVEAPGFDRLAMARASLVTGTLHVRRLLRATGWFDAWATRFTADHWAPPDPDAKPRILFMARAWPPLPGVVARTDRADQVAESRAALVRALRAHFGPRFVGGLFPDAYARARYTDALVDDARWCERKRYLRLLRRFPICIATEGLHRSNGWKLAEYVCYSKAIVSEPVVYGLPGPFAAGANYLEFESPADCVAACERLVADIELRRRLMRSNHAYHREWLRPDALVGRTLTLALDATP